MMWLFEKYTFVLCVTARAYASALSRIKKTEQILPQKNRID